jgi:hypothetical protein
MVGAGSRSAATLGKGVIFLSGITTGWPAYIAQALASAEPAASLNPALSMLKIPPI